jgi:hypothetical protein
MTGWTVFAIVAAIVVGAAVGILLHRVVWKFLLREKVTGAKKSELDTKYDLK